MTFVLRNEWVKCLQREEREPYIQESVASFVHVLESCQAIGDGMREPEPDQGA